MPWRTVGIDAGATLCKLALSSERLETQVFPSTELAAVQRCIRAWGPERIVATGGAATQLATQVAGIPVKRVSEFEAWAQGASLLARREGLDLPARYLLVSLGTGTSVLLITRCGAERVGGSALGGGTLVGLGRLLLQVSSFAKLSKLAAAGDRRQVDLLVRDIYRDASSPLPGDVTAASFGKLHSTRPEDLAHAIVGLVGENVGLICGGLAHSASAAAIVFGGSTLAENPALEEILRVMTLASGSTPHFLAQGAFCGAVGAAALDGP